MKKRNLMLAVLALMLLAAVGDPSMGTVSPVAREIEKGIETAIGQFEQGKAGAGALSLIDVVLLTRPRDSWPEGFLKTILEARLCFEKENHAAGVSRIVKALPLIRPSEAKQESNPEKSTAGVAEIMHQRITGAREKFQAGLADDGVILLLESLQLLAPVQN